MPDLFRSNKGFFSDLSTENMHISTRLSILISRQGQGGGVARRTRRVHGQTVLSVYPGNDVANDCGGRWLAVTQAGECDKN